MRKFLRYLNPVAHLGERHYSFAFPFLTNLSLCILSELYAYGIAHNPMSVGGYIIFLNAAFIIYFAFREGLLGGFISTAVSALYYLYIIQTRHFVGVQFQSGIDTTIILSLLYFLLAGIIGWLKQRIDWLIERQADEKQRLETIIQQLPVGVLITDSNGRLTQRNKQIDNILGVQIPFGFILGKDTLEKEKIDGQIINPSQSPLSQALKTGKPVIGRELSFERNDGKKLALLVSSTPVQNKANNVIAAVSIVSDITKIKELEQQKDDFLGVASHELKTPVTSIKAYTQVLLRQLGNEGNKRSVSLVQKMDVQIDKV